MNNLLLNLKLLLKGVAFMLFFLLSAYVLSFGKKGTGIKVDYVFTGLFLVAIILRL